MIKQLPVLGSSEWLSRVAETSRDREAMHSHQEREQEQNTWLSHVDPEAIRDIELPLDSILQDSLYYPASGFDGDPIRYLAGNLFSFVYVDYGQGREDLDNTPGFRGYRVIAEKTELVPRGYTYSFTPSPTDGDPSKYRGWMQEPFCSWIILERRPERPARHGPDRFSLLYLCADGVAAFQALYTSNSKFPACVAIIQPGTGFGGNWTDFRDPTRIFARSVLQNPAGKPRILLYGGIGPGDGYDQPCWPDYSQMIYPHCCDCARLTQQAHAVVQCRQHSMGLAGLPPEDPPYLAREGRGSIGVWLNSDQGTA